jgi:signal transduction histidine kinase
VIVLDNKDNIVNSNPAAQKMIADITGEFSSTSLQKLLAASSTNTSVEGGEPTRRYDMNGRVLSASSARVKTPEGSPIGTVMVLRDITRAVEAEHLKDDFITSMSHELRTPLTIVKLYTDLLKRSANGSLPQEQVTYLEKISKGSSELEAHIQKMINISEIQAGTLHLKQTEVSFTTFVRELAQEWRPKIEAKEIFFAVQVPEMPLPVSVDADRLQWAITNLLENALTYTAEKGTVQLTVHHDSEHVYLRVADSGIGIAHADQPFVFERFFRAKNDLNYNERGIGLGLYIAREILQLHGGRLTMESKAGVGSTFTCALPLIGETAVTKEPV